MTKSKNRVTVNISKKKKKSKVSKETAQLTRLGAALRGLGGLAGGAVGGLVGYGGAGSSAGTNLGAAISRWLGSGDYSVSSNSIVSNSQRASNSIPMMHKTNQTITVRHREFVCSLNGTANFNVQRFFPLQPADSITFPWLSTLATRFQQYKFKGLVFHYIPTSGMAISGTNSALGAVMMQTSYRANEDPPSSKAEMMNEYWACEASPHESFCHPIECDPKENPFSIHYTRTKPVPNSDSLLMYDLGVLFVATQGQQGTNILGDLWVTYEVELSKPIIESNVSGPLHSARLTYATATVSNWFGATARTAIGDIPCETINNTLQFPFGTVGEFEVSVFFTSTTNFTAMNLSGAPTLVNCVGITLLQSDDSNSYSRTVVTGAAAVFSRGYYITSVRLSDPSNFASITFPTVTWTGTPTSLDVVISRLG